MMMMGGAKGVVGWVVWGFGVRSQPVEAVCRWRVHEADISDGLGGPFSAGWCLMLGELVVSSAGRAPYQMGGGWMDGWMAMGERCRTYVAMTMTALLGWAGLAVLHPIPPSIPSPVRTSFRFT